MISNKLLIIIVGLGFMISFNGAFAVYEQDLVIVYDSGSYDRCWDVAVDSSDNIIVVGEGIVVPGSPRPILIIKYDPEGNEIWNQTFDYYEASYGIFVTVDPDDNIIIGHRALVSSSYDFLIIKYDSAGSELWNLSYNAGYNDWVWDIETDSLGNIIATGTMSATLMSDMHTVKFDSDGTFLWNLTFDDGSIDYGKAVALDSEDNIIVGMDITDEHHNRDYHIRKYTKDGDFLGSVSFGGPMHDEVADLTIDTQDNIIVTGTSFFNYMTIKYDKELVEQWNATYNGGISDTAEGVATDSYDNVFVTGTSRFETSEGYDNVYTIKYDYAGNELWNATYDYMGSADYPQEIVIDSQNRVIISGHAVGDTMDYFTIRYTYTSSETEEISTYIDDLPDYVFKNNPEHRRNTLLEKMDAVIELINAGDYEHAINKLNHDIRAKADGYLGGNPKNDWITDEITQRELNNLIDELIVYIEGLMAL